MQYGFGYSTLSLWGGLAILLYLFIVWSLLLSPALFAFARAVRYFKKPAPNAKWHQKPHILIILGILYIVAIPLYMHAGDVRKALKITNKYKGPIYMVSLEDYKLKTMYASKIGQYEQEVSLFYHSPNGRLSIDQRASLYSLPREITQPCVREKGCKLQYETRLGKARYYDRNGSQSSWIKTEHGFVTIRQFGGADAKEEIPKRHALIADSLEPATSRELLKTIILKIESR